MTLLHIICKLVDCLVFIRQYDYKSEGIHFDEK